MSITLMNGNLLVMVVGMHLVHLGLLVLLMHGKLMLRCMMRFDVLCSGDATDFTRIANRQDIGRGPIMRLPETEFDEHVLPVIGLELCRVVRGGGKCRTVPVAMLMLHCLLLLLLLLSLLHSIRVVIFLLHWLRLVGRRSVCRVRVVQ